MESNNGKYSASLRNLSGQVIRFRWLAMLLALVITVFLFMNMKNLVFDSSADIWFVENDESIVIMKQFEDAFGNDDFVSLFLKADSNGKFTPEMMRKFNNVAYDLEDQVPYLKKVMWLGNVEWVDTIADGISIDGFMDPIPETQDEIDKLLDKALTEPSYVNAVISENKSLVAMHLDLYHYTEDNEEDKNPRYSVAKAVYKVINSEKYKDLDIIVVGGPAGQYQYDKLVAADGKKFFILTVAIMFALMIWVGRGFRGVLLPILCVVLPVFWTMGSIPFMGITINFLTMALPTILICVGIADSMHYISAFYDCADAGIGRKKSIMEGLGLTGKAIIMTTMTTIIGFLSFLATDVKPFREMGLYVALGVAFAMLVTVILVPSIFSFGKDEVKPAKKRLKGRGDIFDKALTGVFGIVTKHTWKVLIFFSILTLVSIYGMTQAKVESNTMKLVKKGNELRDNIDYIGNKMGGVLSLEFMVDTGKPDGIKSADFMKKLDIFHQRLEQLDDVTKVSSITSAIKKTRKALHGNDSSYYSIPDDDKALAQYLFMYEISGGDDMDKMVTFTSDKVRVTAKTASLSTFECRTVQDYAIKAASEIFGDDVKVIMSGGVYRYLRLNDILGEGQKSSFIAAMIAISIVMIFFMRSFGLGLISMIPNIFPVMISLGVIGLLGIYVDVILLSFAPVIIGVSVDDTIHFFSRFRKEFDAGHSYEEALRRTYLTVGRPIIFTTMVLVLGFSPFIFSQLTGYIKNGFMMGWAFSWALLADFFFAPALLLITKPLGKSKEA